jgi:hypothetical protein
MTTTGAAPSNSRGRPLYSQDQGDVPCAPASIKSGCNASGHAQVREQEACGLHRQARTTAIRRRCDPRNGLTARKGIAVSEQFSKTLAAARALQSAEISLWALQWALGDALIEECGPPGDNGVRTGAYERIENAHKALKQEGLREYSLDHLRDFRKVAAAFPAGEPGCVMVRPPRSRRSRDAKSRHPSRGNGGQAPHSELGGKLQGR